MIRSTGAGRAAWGAGVRDAARGRRCRTPDLVVCLGGCVPALPAYPVISAQVVPSPQSRSLQRADRSRRGRGVMTVIGPCRRVARNPVLSACLSPRDAIAAVAAVEKAECPERSRLRRPPPPLRHRLQDQLAERRLTSGRHQVLVGRLFNHTRNLGRWAENVAVSGHCGSYPRAAALTGGSSGAASRRPHSSVFRQSLFRRPLPPAGRS